MQIGQEKMIVESPSEILVLINGEYMDVTREGVIYALNLVWWGILYLYFQVIERTWFGRPSHGIYEDIDSFFLLISTSAHKGAIQDGIHDYEGRDDDNCVMDAVD